MKETLKKVFRDMLRRYLPIIINTICASICVSTAGCAVVGADKVDFNICPIEKGF